MKRALVPVSSLARSEKISGPLFRLSLERLPGDRVQTPFIDVSGEQFKAWSRGTIVDAAIEGLAVALALHLKIARDDVDINEDTGIRGARRFRLIAHYLGKPKEATDGYAAFMQWHSSSGNKQPRILPDFIDV